MLTVVIYLKICLVQLTVLVNMMIRMIKCKNIILLPFTLHLRNHPLEELKECEQEQKTEYSFFPVFFQLQRILEG